MSQTAKLVVLMVGIFAAGGVTGGFIALRVAEPKFAPHPPPEDWAPRHLKRLTERLDLTPAQQELVRPIVKLNLDELKRLRTRSMAETKTVFERMDHDISEQLTPEQKIKFEEFNREMREKMEKMRRPGGDHPGDRPPPPPPDKP